MTAGRILVIRGGAIGDFILTLPVLAALRQQFPDTHLELLGYPQIAGLALAGGLVQAVKPIEARPMAGFFARRGELAQSLQEYFAQFAIIISYLYDPDGIFQENIARCSKAQFIAGPHRPDEAANIHATKVFLKPLERLAIFDADSTPRLRIDLPLSDPSQENFLKGALAVHPGSGSEKKNWPEERWAELLKRLGVETRLRFLLIGGEAEGERLERLAGLLPSDRVRLSAHLPLPELAVLLQHAAAFVGHDSGITHLAAAVGCAGCVLWGSSNKAVWTPCSDRMTIVDGNPDLAQLSVESVMSGLATSCALIRNFGVK